jgi:predicted peroxiredoxin
MVDLFCIASGPSLTAEDCELVRKSSIKTVAVNNSWEMATFCHYIYAGDSKWWVLNHDKINIGAEKWTCSDKAANAYKLHYHIASGPYNSGMRAIQFGISKGFKSIALLGYDCSIKNGIHWHGSHPLPVLRNPTVPKIEKWKEQFKRVAENAKKQGIKIYNCSRYTELECFDIMSLEDALKI